MVEKRLATATHHIGVAINCQVGHAQINGIRVAIHLEYVGAIRLRRPYVITITIHSKCALVGSAILNVIRIAKDLVAIVYDDFRMRLVVLGHVS